jgi:hypothetical protein
MGVEDYLCAAMVKRSDGTRYYLNPKLARLAIIRSGVRFPRGHWLPIADQQISPIQAEELVLQMFPTLTKVAFDHFLTDFDVEEFERVLSGPAD